MIQEHEIVLYQVEDTNICVNVVFKDETFWMTQKAMAELFEEICDFKTVSLNGVYFALMHYPMLSWPKKNSGSIQLHGHIHAREEYNLQNKVDGITRYDVGVDANDYYPVSVKQIIEFFED